MFLVIRVVVQRSLIIFTIPSLCECNINMNHKNLYKLENTEMECFVN
jgi:hypothetical protein